MPENEGKLMTRGHAVESKAHVRMANSTSSNFDNDFARTRIKGREFDSLQRGVRSLQLETVRSVNACHLGPLPLQVSLLNRPVKIASKLAVNSDLGHRLA